jgi:hypothetical protein
MPTCTSDVRARHLEARTAGARSIPAILMRAFPKIEVGWRLGRPD